jgi:trans-aconitate 2-methyltransferase
VERFEWDARSYDSLPLPHRHWGAAIVAQLPLSGDETVLELGCGTGRDTELLLPRLPRGKVLAVDGSQQMLAAFRERIGDDPRVHAIHADLREPLGVAGRADVAFSVATLHWVPDHQAVFTRLADSLRPGATWMAECGGAGNIAAVRSAIERVDGAVALNPWNFAGIEDTRTALQEAGFRDIEVRLVPDPAHLERGEQLEAYLATVVLGAHLRERPPGEHRDYVRAIAGFLPAPTVDYVRLQLRAVRA